MNELILKLIREGITITFSPDVNKMVQVTMIKESSKVNFKMTHELMERNSSILVMQIQEASDKLKKFL